MDFILPPVRGKRGIVQDKCAVRGISQKLLRKTERSENRRLRGLGRVVEFSLHPYPAGREALLIHQNTVIRGRRIRLFLLAKPGPFPRTA